MPENTIGINYLQSCMGPHTDNAGQTQQLARVNESISGLVERFVTERMTSGARKFHMRDLHDFIYKATQIAPASPDRILRDLRSRKKCNYKVLSRRDSFYELLPVSQAV